MPQPNIGQILVFVNITNMRLLPVNTTYMWLQLVRSRKVKPPDKPVVEDVSDGTSSEPDLSLEELLDVESSKSVTDASHPHSGTGVIFKVNAEKQASSKVNGALALPLRVVIDRRVRKTIYIRLQFRKRSGT